MKILFVLDYLTFKENLFFTAEKASKYADFIWFRIKNEEADKIYKLSVKLMSLFPNVKFILSERADIAFSANFFGVHLNSFYIPPDKIKKSFPSLNVSYSAHSIDEILEINCDFYTLSPIFYTEKPYEVKPLGVIDVSCYNKKIFALGGINKNNVSELQDKGFYGVAGIGFIDDLKIIKNVLS